MYKTVIVLWGDAPLSREEVQDMLDYAPGGVVRATEADAGRVHDPRADAHWGGDDVPVLLDRLDPEADDGATGGGDAADDDELLDEDDEEERDR